MALRRPAGDRTARLDPVRWPTALRRANLLRGGLVAGLLATAAGVLYAGAPPARCDPGRTGSAAPPATAGTAPSPVGSQSPGGTAPSPVARKAPGGTAPFRRGERSGPAHRGSAGGGDGDAELPAGTVGVAVQLADPTVLGILRPGDRVDLLAVAPAGGPARPGPRGSRAHSSAPAGPTGPDGGGEATTVADNVLVLATPGHADPAAGGLYLALAPRQARAVVALPPDTRLAVIVRA